jgi:hypothetical protein
MTVGKFAVQRFNTWKHAVSAVRLEEFQDEDFFDEIREFVRTPMRRHAK